MTEANKTGALDGVLIIDLSRYVAGPFATMLLGDLGAEIIKIEPPGKGDDMRGWPPFIAGQGAYFLTVNRNKKSMTLNTRTDKGKEILWRLIESADVLYENFRPGVMEKMGFGWEQLHQRNPKLIFCRVSAFGRTGPYATRPGYDQIVQGMSGFMSITGSKECGPFRAGLAIADLTTAMYAAYGILAALFAREKTGKGQVVQTSLLQSMVSLLTMQAGKYFATGKTPEPAGNDHPVAVPYGVYRAKDGLFNLAVGADAMFKRLCEVLGRPELADDPDFKDGDARLKNRQKLNAILSEIFSQKTVKEWTEYLNDKGIPCGPIYTIDQVFKDPQVLHLGLLLKMHHPRLGEIPMPGMAVEFSETPADAKYPPPLVGEHTEEVLKRFGYSEREIENFKKEGIV